MQGKLEVGVRLIPETRHAADELAHVTLLLPVQAAPGRPRASHFRRLPAPASRSRPLSRELALPPRCSWERAEAALARARASAAVVAAAFVSQSSLGKYRPLLKDSDVFVNQTDISLWITVVNGLTSDGREQPVGSHSVQLFAPAFPNVLVVHPAQASASPCSGDL